MSGLNELRKKTLMPLILWSVILMFVPSNTAAFAGQNIIRSAREGQGRTAGRPGSSDAMAAMRQVLSGIGSGNSIEEIDQVAARFVASAGDSRLDAVEPMARLLAHSVNGNSWLTRFACGSLRHKNDLVAVSRLIVAFSEDHDDALQNRLRDVLRAAGSPESLHASREMSERIRTNMPVIQNFLDKLAEPATSESALRAATAFCSEFSAPELSNATEAMVENLLEKAGNGRLSPEGASFAHLIAMVLESSPGFARTRNLVLPLLPRLIEALPPGDNGMFEYPARGRWGREESTVNEPSTIRISLNSSGTRPDAEHGYCRWLEALAAVSGENDNYHSIYELLESTVKFEQDPLNIASYLIYANPEELKSLTPTDQARYAALLCRQRQMAEDTVVAEYFGAAMDRLSDLSNR